ncbi:flagellar rod protein FlaI [Vibrio sp. ES.051]|uniref:flagellar protein FliT n=1 Tax=Vibrio sp. ES.051 TaxID=1761909 RepID=UPI000BF556C6|nr:flagellar protein FliT [Vibrio sp. ES.051]PFG55638.1 flagellar rod protein FlaI [Vibrio sp. ES.051]
MQNELIEIGDIDQLITQELEKVDFNTEEILRLVDTRERLLQNLLPIIVQNPLVKQDAEWQDLLTRTQIIVELMQSETSKVGKELHKFRYGQRSLQQYKKFI